MVQAFYFGRYTGTNKVFNYFILKAVVQTFIVTNLKIVV